MTVRRFTKRTFDVVLATAALVVLAPVLLVIAVAIRLRMGSPVLFRQLRPGRDAEPFTMLKFRTMLVDAARDGRLLADSERLTPLGRFLRRTSLDELPELVNVVKGEMSLVGPRPLLMEYLPLYNSQQARRHEVLPGITGWAQVNGRNALSWEDKFRLDVWYVDHHSLLLDLRILWRTALDVVRARDITQPGHATTERFRGS